MKDAKIIDCIIVSDREVCLLFDNTKVLRIFANNFVTDWEVLDGQLFKSDTAPDQSLRIVCLDSQEVTHEWIWERKKILDSLIGYPIQVMEATGNDLDLILNRKEYCFFSTYTADGANEFLSYGEQ